MDIRKYLVKIDSNGQTRPFEYDRDAVKSPLQELNRRNQNTRHQRKSPYHRSRSKSCFIDTEKQYILDLGQKNIDPSECRVCRMLYTRGDAVDEKHHQSYHDAFINGIKLHSWKFERTILYLDNGARIISVFPTDPKHMLKKVEELFRLSDQELGIHVSLDEMTNRDFYYLIYISARRRVGGFVVGERIQQASRVVCENPLSISQEVEPAEVGVSRLWVHHQFRGKGIATMLVDVLRANLYRNRIVQRDLVAFSDPTINGKDFAKNYTKNDKFLVYTFNT